VGDGLREVVRKKELAVGEMRLAGTVSLPGAVTKPGIVKWLDCLQL
jgi:hypothetical protein